MQDIRPVPLDQVHRLINHGPTTLITSAHAGARNVMAAAWVMPLDFDPPTLLLVLDHGAHTRGLVEASGEFAVNLPVRAQADACFAAGSVSARDLPAGTDKFAALGLDTFAAAQIAAPLVAGCAAWLECRVRPDAANAARDLFIAEVVAAHADARVFSGGRWHFPDEASRTIHHVAGGAFFATGEAFQAAAN